MASAAVAEPQPKYVQLLDDTEYSKLEKLAETSPGVATLLALGSNLDERTRHAFAHVVETAEELENAAKHAEFLRAQQHALADLLKNVLATAENS
jgi:hypothetical protein